MEFSITQIFFAIFLFFALSRVVLRFRGGNLTLFGVFFWSSVFITAIIVVLFPYLSSSIAHMLGIGRGVDVIVYASIVILFYLVFRLYVYLQDMRHEMTSLIRKMALKELKEKHVTKTSSH